MRKATLALLLGAVSASAVHARQALEVFAVNFARMDNDSLRRASRLAEEIPESAGVSTEWIFLFGGGS